MRTSTVYLLIMTTVVTMPTGVRSKFQEEESTNLFQYRPSTNLQLYGDNVLVSSKNGIRLFDKDLQPIEFYNTCVSTAEKCENYNQVMIVNDKKSELIICGTGNNGKCEVLGLPGLNVLIGANVSELGISSDPAKPSVALLGVNLTMAVTNGPNENNAYIYSSSTSKTFAISERNASTLTINKDNANNANYGKLRFNDKGESYFLDFIVYYKDGFNYEGYSYFVTNQNKNGLRPGPTDMVSKMVRLCQNDPYFKGYVDFEIGCQDPAGKDYNLIQHIVHTKTHDGKVWIIGVFTQSEDAEDLSGDSVVCTTTLDEVDKTINSTWEDFYYCKDIYKTVERYLIDNRMSTSLPVCVPSEPYSEADFLCKNKLDIFSYNIGLKKRNMTFAYKVDSKRGYVTAAHLTYNLDGRNPGGADSSSPVMLLGTSEGKIIMTSVKTVNGQMTITEYFDHSLKNERRISAIHQKDENILYVLSEKKVYKFSSTNCSEFTSCQDTMNVANPLCGWCVRKNSATRQQNCTNNEKWLPALDGKCPSFTTVPKGARIGSSGSVGNVIITAEDIPPQQSSDIYECVFSSLKFANTFQMPATCNNDKFTCPIPKVQTHTEAALMIRIKASDIVLARGKFLFYDCAEYKKCGDCIGHDGIMCRWSASTLTCDVGNNGIDDKTSCPELTGNQNFYIPSNQESTLQVRGKNLDANHKYKCSVGEQCVDATVSNEMISCSVKLPSNKNITNKKISVKYKLSSSPVSSCSDMISLDESGEENKVIVYNCSALAHSDCSICCALNKTRYKCSWENGSCVYKAGSSQCEGTQCPAPVITRLSPSDGPYRGGTVLTIYGRHFGYWTTDIISRLNSIDAVKLGPQKCVLSENKEDYAVGAMPDFVKPYLSRIVCTVPSTDFQTNTKVNVSLKVEPSKRSENVTFEYKVPNVTEIKPSQGPESGGTRITLYGNNLLIGNQLVSIEMNDQVKCTDVTLRNVDGKNHEISCLTGKKGGLVALQDVRIMMDGKLYTSQKSFRYIDDPTISGIEPKKAILSGGTKMTIMGTNMQNSAKIRISVNYEGKSQFTGCINKTNEVAICPVPKAPDILKEDLMESLTKRRKRRSVADGCTEIKMVIHMDGVKEEFTFSYCRDPELEQFENGVLLYKSGDKNITIKGEYLTLATSVQDFSVTVGVEVCRVLELKPHEIVCIPPYENPGSGDQQVTASVGYLGVQIGRLQYEEDSDMTLVIVLSVVGSVCFLSLLILGFGCFKYRRVTKKYVKELKNIEMEMIDVARQEFMDMHTTMSSVSRNLGEQRFPYHNYQQYACNVMFSVDYRWMEPVMKNSERLRTYKGMQKLEQLINNKFFLVSVIGTMEKQRKFSIGEKSNLPGNLCAILMGRMEYLNEVLRILMTNLVRDSSGKKAQQKALFKGSETITEKLLSNWMSLCLYPHFMSHSGSPLYLLYMALQKTIESGPIDAVTGYSKYTLSEDRLLKKISRSMSEEDLKFESKVLTLNVVVNGVEEIFKCKVLDCDTISQVKSKCLSQIYVNHPASKINVDSEDIFLEWREGLGGTLRLNELDNTSIREGPWVRLNTLAHYNVKDDSNLALVDPHSAEAQQEDYGQQINMDVGGSNGSMDTSDRLKLNTDVFEDDIQYWHLVKQEEKSSKQEKSAITELYLNRLFTTKQSFNKYMKKMFNIVLDIDTCPPPTKFLLDFLDELADQFKVDNDTIHLWKSHSYAISIWAALMKMPSLLFDVQIPLYVGCNLEVISQVFIDSFSLASPKFTKDSPSQKLIFHHEMTECRERAFEFYRNVKVDTQDAEELRQYLKDVDKLQQETNFNKNSALYRFYKQLKPYLHDIIEDLAQCKDTKNLQLDKKLEQVVEIMDENEGED